MKRDNSQENDENKNSRDKLDAEQQEELLEEPFQDTPDEGSGDVPHEDKIVEDHETGEKTFIKNDNKSWGR